MSNTKDAIKEPQHPLDALAAGDPRGVIALMLWQRRFEQPDLYAQITEKDIVGFQDCVRYMKVTPEVQILRPAGIEAQPAIPATKNRRAVPARPATDPKPYVIVRLVEKGTENAIRPVENNQEDYDKMAASAQVKQARDSAPGLAQRLIQQANSGEYSLSDMQDAANALMILARQ